MTSRTGGPSRFRRLWCLATGGHRFKFSAHPRMSCIRCGWWPGWAQSRKGS